ncbi:hypothetical protein JCM11641_001778 [Rhodosporidiobolus odoratus]
MTSLPLSESTRVDVEEKSEALEPVHDDETSTQSEATMGATKKKKKHPKKSPSSLSISESPLTVPSLFGSKGIEQAEGISLIDSAISSLSLFVAPTGPSAEVYNFATGRFTEQPEANLEALGFTKRSMNSDEFDSFLMCAISAGVPSEVLQEVVEAVNFEPHNPLLDIPDDEDPADDLTHDEAQSQLADMLAEFDDLFVDSLPGLPPFRPVNHKIALKDTERKIRPHAIRMPDRYKAQWTAHLRKFVDGGFWSPAALDSACAMFAVPKHNKTQARFVVNLKPRNENTVKLASPIPDMKEVRYRVVSKKYRSKLDFKQAYEQIRLNAESVGLSGFVTPNGTFVSHVMQQGDTNAPETMHQVCYLMFSKAIGRFLDVFYDDVLVYSDTRRAHLRHLRIVLTSLRHYRFFLLKSKVEFFAETMEVIGAVVDSTGVHVVPDKWEAIQRWPKPKNPKDILRFMGTVQWTSDHLPHLNEIAAVLTRLTGKATWNWTPACDMAFDLLKSLVPRSLSPLNLDAIDDGTERLFLFTDASVFGCGGWLGQEANRDTARPFRFFSAKFNSAQRNYSTTDQELLAVFVGTKKMHEHLVGFHFTVVCDHEPLKNWYELDWEFIPGVQNVLADALSRLAELDESERLGLPEAPEPTPAADNDTSFPSEPSDRAHVVLSFLLASLAAVGFPPSVPIVAPLATSSITSSLPPTFLLSLRSALSSDTLASKILSSPSAHTGFAVNDGLVFREMGEGWRLVLPAGKFTRDDGRDSTLVETVVARSHELVGHLGASKTLEYTRRFFWWKTMAVDVVDFCRSCEACSRNKSTTQAPYGFLHAFDPPAWCWSRVGMDFVVGLPTSLFLSSPVDSILTVTDYLSKMVVLIPLLSTASALDVADLFHSHIFRRFGLPSTVVSDRDPKFTSDFWRALNARIGTSLTMSTAAHPQTDGRAEVTNKTVGQVLRTLCEDSPDNWASKVVACEFALNSVSSAATGLAPFEVVYGFLPTAWPAGSWHAACKRHRLQVGRRRQVTCVGREVEGCLSVEARADGTIDNEPGNIPKNRRESRWER